MAHFSFFNSKWPTIVATTNTEEERNCNDHPEHVRAALGNHGEFCGGEFGVFDETREEKNGAPNNNGGEVHAVQSLEPFHFFHAMLAAGRAQGSNGIEAKGVHA